MKLGRSGRSDQGGAEELRRPNGCAILWAWKGAAMAKELTLAEKMRIFYKFLIQHRASMTLAPDEASRRAAKDYRAELQKHSRGEQINIPPPVRRRSEMTTPSLAKVAGTAMQSVFGRSPQEARFAVVELALMALADNGPQEASSREMENFEALAEDDPESLLAAVNAAILHEGQSLRLPNPPTMENLREWADQLVSLVISSYPSDELPVPL